MKTPLIALFALTATLNLFAQGPAGDEPEQATAIEQPEAAIQPEPVSQPQKAEQIGLTLRDNKVWLIENGEPKEITEEIWMRNGMQITPSGTLIFANGERAKLREGDFVDMKGAVARPFPVGTEVATK